MGYPCGFSGASTTLVPQPLPCVSKPARRLQLLDLFSGMGGISLGLAPWFESVAYCDVNEHSRAVLAARQADGSLDQGPIYPDIRTLDAATLEADGVGPIEAICGGFPCTGISAAGKKDGLANVQTCLFHDIMRLIDSLPSVQCVFLENVARITSGAMAKDLRVVLQSLTDRGFGVRYVSMLATNVGAPQTRSRWFLLATRGAFDADAFDVRPLSTARIREQFFPFWAQEPDPTLVPRQLDGAKLTKEEARDRKKRLQRLGNSVVPAMIAVAFETMVAGFEAVEQAEPKPKKRRV